MLKIKIIACLVLPIAAFIASPNLIYSQQTPQQIALAESNNPAKCIRGTEMACFDYSKIKNICGSVSQQTEDRGGGDYSFRFERELHEAARVSKSDSEEVEIEKVRKMWTAFDSVNAFSCINNYLIVKPGSILKLAVAVQFGDFLSLLVSTYEVPVNRIDANDGKTVLDFIDDEKKRNSQTPSIIIKLNNYYKRIRNAGGKHAWELKNEKK